MEPVPNVSDWSQIVNVIRDLMEQSPGMGAIVIIVSLLVIASLVALTTWSIIKIIRAKKEPHMKNILTVVRVLTEIMAERDRLSRRHEHIKENSLVRDQMAIVEGVIEDIQNHSLIQISRVLTDQQPDDSDINITNSPEYLQARDTLILIFGDVHVALRRAIKENHIDEKTEAEFYDYANEKIARLKTLILQTVNVRSTSISIDKMLSGLFEQQWTTIEPMVRKMFMNLRQIKLKYAELISTEETMFDQQWTEFMNKMPEMITRGQVEPDLEVLDAVD